MVDWEILIYSSELFQMVIFLKCRVVKYDSSWDEWWKRRDRKKIYIYMYAFSRHFIQSDLQYIQVINVFVSMCVHWELIPQPLRC